MEERERIKSDREQFRGGVAPENLPVSARESFPDAANIEERKDALESVERDLEGERRREEAYEVIKEKDRLYRTHQNKVLPKKEFYESFRKGEYTKNINVESGRVPWRFWQHSEEIVLDISPPDEYLKEDAPPLVIVGGLGSGVTSYLENMYEAVTAGRRVIFMNPSRTFRAREQDQERIDFLEKQSGGNIPNALVRKASGGMQLLESLGVDQFDMIGHSQGGIVSAGMLALSGDRVRVWNPVSPAGMLDKDRLLPLAARFGHEWAHRVLSERFPALYRGLGIAAEKLGILKLLYRNQENPNGEYSLENQMSKPHRQQDDLSYEKYPSANKKMQAVSKFEKFNLLRVGGMIVAAKRISEARLVDIIEYLGEEEDLQTKISLMVAHGEATFPEYRILNSTKDLNIMQYSTLDRYDGHSFQGIAMRNILEILESEDLIGVKMDTKTTL